MDTVPVMSRIVKRNGEEVAFDARKIQRALVRAGKATGEFDELEAQRLSVRVLGIAQSMFAGDIPSVESVQDIVEEVLIASPYRRTAKAYILYREQHARLRELATQMTAEMVDTYLTRADWKVKENSNMAFSLQGLNHYIASEVSKRYWLNKIYPPQIKAAHDDGDLHIHDLGLISVYCVGWDLYDLLTVGFKGAAGKMESVPAKHFRSALGQIVNFFYTLQGEAAGAQAFSNFDTLLAPFIHYDNLSYNEVKQALQEFIFNVNVPTRVGFQTPFTNITMDVVVPSYYADQGVVIGGKVQNKTYKEFQKEVHLFNQAFLEVMMEGDAKGRVFTFPIPTYNITKDFDWNNPHLKSLWDITARYGVPYFSNFINSDLNPEDARSMCCRLRLDNRELRSRGGGLFGASPLTGSIGVVTINLARLGYLADNEEQFFSRLERQMLIARDSLEIKRKILERLTENDLYPYIKFYLRQVKARFDEYWKNHFATIGLVGMNEACRNLLGRDIASPEGHALAERTLDFMRNKLLEFQEETGNNYNLEATPAEGVSYRLARKDKSMYPDCRCANESEYQDGKEPFYTNSTHLPVDYSDDLFAVLAQQDSLQTRYTGGTVLHGFIGEKIHDTAALKRLVRTICEKFHLPYFTITPTFSVCPSCGYQAGEYPACPSCGSECEVYSRVVGYLRPVQQWNKGKQQEFIQRRTYRICESADCKSCH